MAAQTTHQGSLPLLKEVTVEGLVGDLCSCLSKERVQGGDKELATPAQVIKLIKLIQAMPTPCAFRVSLVAHERLQGSYRFLLWRLWSERSKQATRGSGGGLVPP